MLSKSLLELDLKVKYDVVVSRLNRAGIELVPSNHSTLQFGDILNLVGRPEAIEAVASWWGMPSKNYNRCRCCRYLSG